MSELLVLRRPRPPAIVPPLLSFIAGFIDSFTVLALFGLFVAQVTGDRQIDDVKRSDINHLLDDIEDQRGAAMADQILATLRRICNWHAIRDDQFRTPFVRGMARRKPEQRERDRILTDDELRRVWRTAEVFASP